MPTGVYVRTEKNTKTCFKKGHIPHNKDKELSEETKQKVSNSVKKMWDDGYYKDRNTVVPNGWNKGKTTPDDVRKKISNTLKGVKLSPQRCENIRKSLIGHKRMGEGIAKKVDRKHYTYSHNWIKRNYIKNNKCALCGNENANLYDWSNKSQQYKLEKDDWWVLCRKCHINYDKDIRLNRKGI